MKPKLRFSNFNDTWAGMNLGEISNVTIGEFVIKTKQSDDGQYPVYNGGQTPTGYYHEYNNEGNKIVISARGASAGFVNFEYERYWAGNSCYSVSLTKPTYNIRFFYHYLKAYQRRFTDYQQAANIPSVSKKDVQIFQVKVPCGKEQNRIAEFFDCFDKKINLLTKKKQALEAYKKGLMQKIFSQELRFKREDGTDYPEWEFIKLNNFLSLPVDDDCKEPDPSRILTVKLHRKGIVNAVISTSNKLAANYKYRRKGQLIYGKQNLFNGAVGIVPEEFDGFISSTDIPTLDINQKFILPAYLDLYFGRENFYKSLEKFATGSGSKRIHQNTILNLEINLPSIEEQRAISSMVNSLELNTSILKRKIKKAQNLKQGLLQQMFV